MNDEQKQKAIQFLTIAKKNGYHKEDVKIMGIMACCSNNVDDSLNYLASEVDKKRPTADIVEELLKHVRKELIITADD